MECRIVHTGSLSAPALAIVHAGVGTVHEFMETAACIQSEYPDAGLAVEFWREWAGGAMWCRYAYFLTPAQRERESALETARIAARAVARARVLELAEAERKRKKMEQKPAKPKTVPTPYD